MSKSDLFYGQFVTGFLVCLACIAVHSIFMAVVAWAAEGAYQFAEALASRVRLVLVMAGTVTALLAAHVIEIFFWGSAYVALDVTANSDDAFYFAFVNYTTLGYGDVLPTSRWRLLGPMAAMNGVLLFGWSTAVIFDVLRNVAQRPAAQAARRR